MMFYYRPWPQVVVLALINIINICVLLTEFTHLCR